MFDLEKSMAAWRRSLEHNSAFDADDVDELARHVRDQVDGLTRTGMAEKEAFERAMRELGSYGDVEQEYRKVYWGKRRRRGEVAGEMARRGALLANFLKVALRNARRNPGFAAINIAGLAVGMACCLLILLHVRTELSFDRFHRDAPHTYRVNWDVHWNEQEGVGPGTPPPLAARLVDDIPDVQAATRLYPVARTTVRRDDAFFNESRIVGADPDFFSFFDFELLEGDPATALRAPNSVVLTQETAHRYFGDEPARGKLITIGEAKQAFAGTYDNVFRVTGIAADPPVSSHIQFDLLTSMSSHPEVAFFDWSWIWMQVTTYAKLHPEHAADPGDVEAQIPKIVQTYAPDAFDRVGFSYQEMIESGGRWDFVLQPLDEVYLGDVGNRLGPTGNRTYVFAFLTVALFVLIIACINFMNLATARSMSRAREVGVRKALGSPRRMLVGQFLVESLTFSLLALLPALAMVYAAVGPFNAWSGNDITMELFGSGWIPLALVGIALIVGLVAGSYPGFFLSNFRPIHVLKGRLQAGGSDRSLRQGLVVFQFSMTIGLIACTLLVQQQMDYLRNADLGFDPEGVVVISNQNNALGDQEGTFKSQLERHENIRSVSISTGVPPEFGFEDYYRVEGGEEIALISYMVDEDFLETMNISMANGRTFDPDAWDETRSVILNQAAVRALAWEDPIEKTVHYPSVGTYRVIGVMEDFNFLNLRQPIVPFALFHSTSASYDIPASYVLVRIDRRELERSLDLLRTEWEALAPGTPFDFAFLDEQFNQEYVADRRLGRMFLIFSLLTIFVACLGLFGLSAFTAERRKKEIGVRKALGASVGSIVVLLSKEFTRLVLLASVLAIPITYFVMRSWLQDFAYHVDLSAWVFVLAGAGALGVALITVGYRSVKAATAAPVESLRYE